MALSFYKLISQMCPFSFVLFDFHIFYYIMTSHSRFCRTSGGAMATFILYAP